MLGKSLIEIHSLYYSGEQRSVIIKPQSAEQQIPAINVIDVQIVLTPTEWTYVSCGNLYLSSRHYACIRVKMTRNTRTYLIKSVIIITDVNYTMH